MTPLDTTLRNLASGARFSRRRRGYDPDEVDAYVSTVSASASQAHEQIRSLSVHVHRLEDEAAKSGGGADDPREILMRTLIVAQRTADTIVSEARTEAGSAIKAAERKAEEIESAASQRLKLAVEEASRLTSEAEESARVHVAEAKRAASVEIAEERQRWNEELKRLEMTRSSLVSASEAARTRLDLERSHLHNITVSLQAFVEEVSLDPALKGIDELLLEPAAHGAEGLPFEPAGEGDVAAPASFENVSPVPVEQIELPEGVAGTALEATALFDVLGEGDLSQTPDDESPDDTTPGAVLEQVLESAASDAPLEEMDDGDVPDITWSDEAETPSSAEGTGPLPSATPAGAGHGRSDTTQTLSLGSAGLLTENQASAVTQSWPAAAREDPPLFDADLTEQFDGDFAEEGSEIDEQLSTGDDTSSAGAGDEFIDQLRRVVRDDAPLPDGEAAMSAFFDHDGDDLGQR